MIPTREESNYLRIVYLLSPLHQLSCFRLALWRFHEIVGQTGLEPAKKPAFKPDPAPYHWALLYLLIASTAPFELVAPVGIAPTYHRL